MSSKFNPSAFAFGVDLIAAAQGQLYFLKQINKQPLLSDAAVVKRALRRYEELWLPLKAEHNDINLMPPLDIAWVWHCHMLSPVAYEKDCMKLVGEYIDHAVIRKEHADSEMAAMTQIAQEIWEGMYLDQPFLVSLDKVDPQELDYQSVVSYDIALAITRQKSFYYQVSLPHYMSITFLRSALLRYQKFLFLKQQNPGLFLVPCYDIDLMWHSHQLHPLIYKTDTERLLGRLFNHDDTVTDRNPDSKLSNADLKTRELWRSTFNEAFSMYGSMFRGEPPEGKLYMMMQTEIFDNCTKYCTIQLDRVKLMDLDETIEKFSLIMEYAGGSRLFQEFKSTTTREWDKRSLRNLSVDSYYHNGLKVTLSYKKGFLCCQDKIILGPVMWDLRRILADPSQTGQPIQRKLPLDDQATIEFSGTVEPLRQGMCILSMLPGKYETAIMPELNESMWGPIPLAPLPTGVDNTCHVASHR